MNLNGVQAWREHQILRLNQTIQDKIISNEHEKMAATRTTTAQEFRTHTQHNGRAKCNLISFTINFLFEWKL